MFKNPFKKSDPCECGNPVPCHSNGRKFLVLYDIVGDGVAKINWKRFNRCTKKPRIFNDNIK